MIAYIDTSIQIKIEQGQPKTHRRLASLPKQCPTRSLASSRRRARATRRRCGVDHQLQLQHPTARAAATTKRSRRRPSSSPNRGHRQKGRGPGTECGGTRARNDALNTPAEEEAARAFLAENAPWLVPGKVVKPPHLDENAPPTPPFTVPKPRLLVPPEDAEAGFESPEAFYGTAKVLPPEAPSPEDVAASINARAAGRARAGGGRPILRPF